MTRAYKIPGAGPRRRRAADTECVLTGEMLPPKSESTVDRLEFIADEVDEQVATYFVPRPPVRALPAVDAPWLMLWIVILSAAISGAVTLWIALRVFGAL